MVVEGRTTALRWVFLHGRAMDHRRWYIFESDAVGQGQSGKLLADITSKTHYIIF